MIQGVIGAAVKEVFGGIVGQLPKPPIAGDIRVTIVLVVEDGKPVLKEGSEIVIDLNLSIGDAE